MAHTVSGKLRKEPFIKIGVGQGGESTMYAIELSEMTKEWNSDEKSYSNYKALFFAKTQAANDFYAKAFAQGSFVVVSCEKLKVEKREYNGEVYVTLQMDNPRLEGALPECDQAGGGQQPPQPQLQQAASSPSPQSQSKKAASQGQAPASYSEPPMDFDDDTPF